MRLALFTPFILPFATFAVDAQTVELAEVNWRGPGCYKIEMPMGTVYFEKDNGVLGFIDPDGSDWIYFGDPTANHVFYFAKTPTTTRRTKITARSGRAAPKAGISTASAARANGADDRRLLERPVWRT